MAFTSALALAATMGAALLLSQILLPSAPLLLPARLLAAQVLAAQILASATRHPYPYLLLTLGHDKDPQRRLDVVCCQVARYS